MQYVRLFHLFNNNASPCYSCLNVKGNYCSVTLKSYFILSSSDRDHRIEEAKGKTAKTVRQIDEAVSTIFRVTFLAFLF